MIRIGLTGGIASGKSTAARMLAQLGAKVLDADRLGHRTYEPGGPAYARVIEAFGEEVRAPDGTIDRAALGKRVFGDPEALSILTGIVWPEIRALARAELDALEREDPDGVAVVEAAVLFEARWDDLFHEIWVVRVERETAVRRLAQRSGMTREQAHARIAAQLSDAERTARAHVVIDNSGTEEELRTQIEREWNRLRTHPAPARTHR
jgi:dephospho-CoA kinase